jgi:hypothetical protein
LKRIPLYPFLVAIYPVLALGAHNITQIHPGDILRPLLISLLVATIVLGLSRLVLRDWHRAALVSVLILILFFSYGQVYAELKAITLGGLPLFRHRTLGPLWLLILGVGIYWLGWKIKAPQAATPWLNLLALLMLIYPTITLIVAATHNILPSNVATTDHVTETNPGDSTTKPDIYYIILDAFGRKDVLYDEYNFDDRPFLDALKARGFYVAECSQSNYAQTELSLSSSLNMNYLDVLGTDYYHLIRSNAVRTFLEARGYQTAAFATGFSWTELDNAKYYYRPVYKSSDLTEFENLLVGTTILRIYRDRKASETSSAQRYRARTLSTLENLKKLPGKQGPLFAFAHIVSPHGPYVFDKDGHPVYYDVDNLTPATEATAYAGQAAFISNRILDTVDSILAKSSTPPIIIIQGDHGPGNFTHEKRMRILNAYYMPLAQEKLYPGISPVNTFRILLNTYFGQSYPLLDDKSYFSTYNNPTVFQLVPNSCPETP